MNPLHVFHELIRTYSRFVETFQDYKNDDIRRWMNERIREGSFLWRQPFVTLRRRYQFGPTLAELAARGVVHGWVPEIFRSKMDEPKSPPIHPCRHQTRAWEILLERGRNCVVTTGTGSGKSFCFAVPVVSTALIENERAGVSPNSRRSVKALLVYPMNALANSQYNDLAARLRGTGVTICNYTQDLRDDPDPPARPSSRSPAARSPGTRR